MNSILFSIKHFLGIPEDDEFFDPTLIVDINSVFSVLRQIGCGPQEGYQIENGENAWDEFLQNDRKRLCYGK